MVSWPISVFLYVTTSTHLFFHKQLTTSPLTWRKQMKKQLTTVKAVYAYFFSGSEASLPIISKVLRWTIKGLNGLLFYIRSILNPNKDLPEGVHFPTSYIIHCNTSAWHRRTTWTNMASLLIFFIKAAANTQFNMIVLKNISQKANRHKLLWYTTKMFFLLTWHTLFLFFCLKATNFDTVQKNDYKATMLLRQKQTKK